MKKVIFGLALSLMSVAAFADSYLEDSARLYNCGGTVELRSYDNNGQQSYALKFINVDSCSNIRLSNGKSYKLTNKSGQFEDKSFTLSNDAVAEARRGLGVLIESNSGSTADEVSVHIRGRQPAPRPRPETRPTPQPEYEPSEWN
jgi:hypothetical protein